MVSPPPIALLGPQSTPTVGAVLRDLASSKNVVAVTAGWQEREADDQPVGQLVGHPVTNLALYARAERVWRAEPDLRRAHRAHQDRLKLLRQSYNVRLEHAMSAWLALEAMAGDSTVLDVERAAALAAVQELDRSHLRRVAELRRRFATEWNASDHATGKRERAEIAAALDSASAVVIAGGHVAVLLNRFRFFNVEPMLHDKPIIAWSAGAMALADRVVLFHDDPPQGPGHAEAFDHGLGIAHGVVPLPSAGKRLRLDDPGRVSRLARRFGPAPCIALDPAEGITRRNGEWEAPGPGSQPLRGARQLAADGRVSAYAP